MAAPPPAAWSRYTVWPPSRSICYGFNAGILKLSNSYTPPNSKTILQHNNAFNDIIQREFQRNRYLGPASRQQLERIIGPFQTSPLSLIPKPHNPDKLPPI